MSLTAALLEITDLVIRFGAQTVIEGVSLTIPLGERHALLGTNGAGKSTLFNAVTGSVRPSAGRVLFRGHDLADAKVHDRARMGIGRTFQISQTFMDRSVLENLRVAAAAKFGPRYGLRPWTANSALEDRVTNCLKSCQLNSIADQWVGTLSYGQQREVEVAMALVGEPDLLLLDEPAAGLSPQARAQLLDRLKNLPRSVTLLFVEHDMDVALSLADKVTVMRDGRVVATGSPKEIRENATVREMYLGKLQ